MVGNSGLKPRYTVLLELASNPNGYTLGELTDKSGLPKRQVASSLGELEIYGMIKGLWERRESDNRWIRKYYMNGEGTSEFVDVLKQNKKEEGMGSVGRES